MYARIYDRRFPYLLEIWYGRFLGEGHSHTEKDIQIQSELEMGFPFKSIKITKPKTDLCLVKKKTVTMKTKGGNSSSFKIKWNK